MPFVPRPQMMRRETALGVVWAAVTLAGWVFAASIAIDTLRTIVPMISPLPWFDGWATIQLLSAWQAGQRTMLDILFSQHGEHRILFPRLVFFADDLLLRGQGRIGIYAIFLVQGLHAALFTAVVASARPARPGRWAVGAAALALLFSLRQAENFTTEFQLQFVGVFAAATLAFVLFCRAVARAEAGRPSGFSLAASLGAVLVATFTMANGILSGCCLVVLALAARRPRGVAILCAAATALLGLVYFATYRGVAHLDSDPSRALRHPLALARYVAAYLGNIEDPGRIGLGTCIGAAGIALTLAAAIRIARRPNTDPGALAMFGVMLFVGGSAAITAAGRLGFGYEQALSSRYVTGSMAFWSAQLCYWWIDPPGLRAGSAGSDGWASWAFGLSRAAIVLTGLGLSAAVYREQDLAKPQIHIQAFAQNASTNLLLLGLDDRATIERAAWNDADVQRWAEFLRNRHISIFAGRDAAARGRPLAERGTMAGAGACTGSVTSAVSDPTLGPGGIRIAGQAVVRGRQRVRRVVVADQQGDVAGFASGRDPGAGLYDWSGFAVAPEGTTLTAYALLDGDRLCSLGSATVAAPIRESSAARDAADGRRPGQASQPVETP